MNNNSLSEKAFRAWVEKNPILVTLWAVSDKSDSFDAFCMKYYTGNLKSKLIKH